MRLHLHFACCALILALVLAAAAPTGLNLCIQKSGKASIGLSCTCDSCAGQSGSEEGKVSDSCCQNCRTGAILHEHCCTCSQLPALASAKTTDTNPRPRPVSLPALKPPAMFVVVHLSAGDSLRQCSLLPAPPLLTRSTVLRL